MRMELTIMEMTFQEAPKPQLTIATRTVGQLMVAGTSPITWATKFATKNIQRMARDLWEKLKAAPVDLGIATNKVNERFIFPRFPLVC